MSPPTRRAALAIAALAASLLACAATAAAEADAATGRPAAEPRPRAVFFGSSTTAGSGASRPERSWTAIVARTLGWTELNRGLSGSTLADLDRAVPSGEERWREAVVSERPDLVIVMYGANDVLARAPLGDGATPGTFRHAAAEVLGGIRAALPDATLVVMTPQPSAATAAERAPYDAALADAAAEARAVFLAAGAAFPQERLAELTSDPLHLNDAGHAALAAFVLERRALFVRASPLPPR